MRKKGLRAFFVLLSVIAGTRAFAQGISAPSEAELKSVKTQTGLCTTENKDTKFFQNYCLSIKQQLEAPCSQELIKKMKDDIADRNQSTAATTPTREKFGFGGQGMNCGRGNAAIKKNEQNFELLIMQFMSSIAIAESGHREYNNLDHFAKEDNAGKQGGLFNIKEEWLKDDRFKCGCQNQNSTGEGKDLTVNDAHLQATCATYVALYWAAKHGTFAGGEKKPGFKCSDKPDDNGGPRGAACAFASLQEIPRTAGASSAGGTLPEYNNPDLEFIDQKMKNYCEKTFDDNGGSRVNTWDQLNGNDWPKANK